MSTYKYPMFKVKTVIRRAIVTPTSVIETFAKSNADDFVVGQTTRSI